MPPTPGRWQGRFDVVVPPNALAVIATYGVVVLSDRMDAAALAAFIVTAPACQSLLEMAGFLPIGC